MAEAFEKQLLEPNTDLEPFEVRFAAIVNQEWDQLFGDYTYADACLSRMTSKAYRLEFPGRDRRATNSN